jgi:hypothetical protein
MGGRGRWMGRGRMVTPSRGPVPPVMGDAVLGPQAPDDLHPFGEPAHALGHPHAEHGELLAAVAEPHAQHEASAGDHVEERPDLRDLDGIVEGQEHEVGAEREALRLGGEALQHRQERKVVEARRGVMLAAPDRVEAERADEPGLLERLREAARGIVAGGVLGVEINAELHDRAQSPRQ